VKELESRERGGNLRSSPDRNDGLSDQVEGFSQEGTREEKLMTGRCEGRAGRVLYVRREGSRKPKIQDEKSVWPESLIRGKRNLFNEEIRLPRKKRDPGGGPKIEGRVSGTSFSAGEAAQRWDLCARDWVVKQEGPEGKSLAFLMAWHKS